MQLPLAVSATGPTSQQVVAALFTLVIVASPVALKYLPVIGFHKALVSFAVAATIALIAGAATGQFDHFDVSSVQSWMVTAGWMWGLQQGIYRALLAVFPQAVQPPVPPVQAKLGTR